MGWMVAAEGVNLLELKRTIADMELPKGTQVKAVMDLKVPLGWAFDVAGAEWIFKPFMPEGVDLVDVYGEGSQGIVEMEADPAVLSAVIGYIATHWYSIAISVFLLGIIIAFITILVKVPVAARIPFLLIVGAAAGILSLTYLRAKKGKT